jgi:hypothetical protein
VKGPKPVLGMDVHELREEVLLLRAVILEFTKMHDKTMEDDSQESVDTFAEDQYWDELLDIGRALLDRNKEQN